MVDLGAVALKITSCVHLKEFHAQIIVSSLYRHNYWVSLLISQCTRLHAPSSYVRLLFDSTRQPNVFVFSNMLKYFSQIGARDDVLTVFRRMRKCNAKPDAFVYPILIKSTGKAGVSVHAHLLKLGHCCDRFVRNSVMDMYAKYGPLDNARELFDEMCDRTVVDWNTMISGHWNWGNVVEANRLFDLMPERNVITWTAMVSGYSRMKDLDSARRYFDKMPERSVVSWNAMLSGYTQNGLAEEAISLFNEMINSSVQPDETTWVAIISSCSSRGDISLVKSLVNTINDKGICLNCFVKTALLDMYAKCGNLELARNLFDELGVDRNSVAWNAMISAYTRVGDLISAKKLFDRMPGKNVISWNSMLSGYAQNGQSEMAIQLFKEMIMNSHLKPDEVTMVSVISACGHLGALEMGNWVVSHLMENQIHLSISGFNSLIFMYSKCGSMNDAEKVFQEMRERDVISYNTLFTGFAAYGYGIKAVKLMQKMKEDGIEPDRITYIGILTACSHAGLLDEGEKVFKLIKAPDVDHYACMVDLLGRMGKIDQANRLIERMPMEPHAGVYGALLNASRIQKRVGLGELAANKLFELEPENSGNYILLSNLYASMGRWENVEMVRWLMRKGGVKKTTGWSWVEHGGKMHKFTVGDRSHERSDDICRVLAELRKKMKAVGYTSDKSCVLRDVEEEEMEEMVGTHSEKLAVAFALIVSEEGAVIRVVKNQRICLDCHTVIKMISKLEVREIVVRDNNRFHCFNNGTCSCNDYW